MRSELYKQKLFAYAMGELKGRDAEEIAAIVAKDAEAARYVEEVRAFSKLAAAELGSEPLPGGGGSLPVFEKIVASQAGAHASSKQRWIQAAALAAVIVLFFAAFPLRKKFSGNVADLLGGAGGGGTSTQTDESTSTAPVKRKVKENPTLVEKDFEELDSRPVISQKVLRCHFALPAKQVADKIQFDQRAKAMAGVYFFAETASELTVTVSTTLQPLVRELDVEELEQLRDNQFAYFRRRSSDQVLRVYKVPLQTHLPACMVDVSLDGNFSEAAKKFIAEPLETFALRVARSMEFK